MNSICENVLKPLRKRTRDDYSKFQARISEVRGLQGPKASADAFSIVAEHGELQLQWPLQPAKITHLTSPFKKKTQNSLFLLEPSGEHF